MTREELTTNIKDYLYSGAWKYSAFWINKDDLSVILKVLEQEPKTEPCEDCISRAELKKRLQEHHDFFVNAYGGFRNLPRNDKARVDEITHCIAEVVNMPSIQPKAEQDPCEDAISRQAAIEALDDEITITGATNAIVVRDYIQRVKRKLDQLPPITPQEPKTGHWVLLDECSNSGYYCSECQKKVVKEGWSKTIKKINYCPNCGCRMENER